MAEELKFNKQVFEARIDTSRPGKTSLSTLTDALSFVGSTLNRFVEASAKRELAQTVEQLSNPLLTVTEAEILQNEATFPLARLRAAQRVGELQVERREQAIRDRLLKAPDIPTAREWLREEQAKDIEEFGTSGDIQVGIRERYAALAPSILADTARRRADAAVQKEDRVEAEGFRLAIEKGGPTTVVNRLLTSQFTIEVAAGDVDALHTTFLASIQADWRAGDNEELDTNVNVDRDLDALDLFLKNVQLTAPVRVAAEKLRDTITTAQQAGVNDSLKLDNAAQDRAHAEMTEIIDTWFLNNPNRHPPKAMADKWLSTARTAARKDAVTVQLRASIDTGANTDLAEMTQVTRTRATLVKLVTKDDGFELEEFGPSVLADFDETILGLPLDLRNDKAALLRAATTLSADLLQRESDNTRAKALTEDEEIEKAADLIVKTRLKEHAKLGPGESLPPVTERTFDLLRDVNRSKWNRLYNTRIQRNLEGLGFKRFDMVGINPKR